MRKIFILPILLITVPVTTAHALNQKQKKNIIITVNGVDKKTTEAKLYQEIFDLEYNVSMKYMVDLFTNDIGIESGYFIDDIKSYAECDAQIFAKELSIDDYKTLMTTYYSEDAKLAIRTGLMIKAKSCFEKYFPYLDSKEATVQEYGVRKCGDADSLNSESARKAWYYCTAKILKQFDMCPEEICPKGSK